MWWPVALAGLASACGRIGFDQLAEAALVQVQAPGYQSAASMTVDIALTAGNFVVVATYWDQSPDTVALVDTAGLAWTPLAIQEIVASCGGGTGNATGARLWYAQVTATAMDKITVAQTSGTQPLGAFVLEYAGIATADAVDAASGRLAPTASTTASAPALKTTGTDVIVAFFGDTISMGSWTPGDGYTALARDTGFPNLIEDAIVPPGRTCRMRCCRRATATHSGSAPRPRSRVPSCSPARPGRSQPDSYCRATDPAGSGAARSDEPVIVPTIALSR